MTRMVPLDPADPDPRVLAEAATTLRSGGLVAFPTETVYGLGADATDPTAVKALFEAKGRPAHDPVIVHVADPAEMDRVAAHVPPVARALAESFWPGPLTLVLDRGPEIPDAVTAGGPTVAVRCPDHPLALALIRAAARPLAAPSANRFSRTSPTTAAHVHHDLAGRIDLILDGGPARVGVESTVLDLTVTPPRILRAGGVPLEALRRVVPDVVLAPRTEPTEGAAALPSPGLMDRHYAPDTPLHLLEGSDEAVRAALAAELDSGGPWREGAAELDAGGRGPAERIGLLLPTEDLDALGWPRVPSQDLGSLHDPETMARRLYQALRELDGQGLDRILTRQVPAAGLGRAIRDRLRRAAAVVRRV